jgi:hypothetical protein
MYWGFSVLSGLMELPLESWLSGVGSWSCGCCWRPQLVDLFQGSSGHWSYLVHGWTGLSSGTWYMRLALRGLLQGLQTMGLLIGALMSVPSFGWLPLDHWMEVICYTVYAWDGLELRHDYSGLQVYSQDQDGLSLGSLTGMPSSGFLLSDCIWGLESIYRVVSRSTISEHQLSRVLLAVSPSGSPGRQNCSQFIVKKDQE